MTPPIQKYSGAALIFIVVLIIYWPAHGGGFIFDDELLLVYNPMIKAPDGLYRFWFTNEALDYWPVTNSTLWLEWRLWKLDPTGYHIGNLLLHVADSLLVWAVLRKLRIPGSFLAAFLFAVHPVNVESVAWISQRKNVLSLFFFLLSILWWLLAEEKRRSKIQLHTTKPRQQNVEETQVRSGWWYALSWLAFLLALLSKGSVAILPLVLILLLWWMYGRLTWQDVVRSAPFFALTVVLTLVNLWFQTHGAVDAIRHVTSIQRMLGAGAVIWFYLFQALIPINLSFIYPQWNIQADEWLWWLPLTAVFVVTVLLMWSLKSRWAKRTRPLFFAWSFFCISLLPVLGFTDVGYMRYSLVADHYEQIAIISVVALAGAAVSYGYRQPRAAVRQTTVFATCAVSTVFLVLTWQQSALYADALTIYEDTVKKNPDSWLVQSNLGLELSRRGKYQEAIPHFQTALQLNPACAEAHFHWGDTLADLDQPQEAIDQYQQALQISPNYAYAHYRLGAAWEALDDSTEAEQEYRTALALKPDIPQAQNSLGLILASHGQFTEALVHFKQALKIDPDFIQPYVNLASAYAALKQYADAISIAQQASTLARSHNETKMAQGIAARLKYYEDCLTHSAKTAN